MTHSLKRISAALLILALSFTLAIPPVQANNGAKNHGASASLNLNFKKANLDAKAKLSNSKSDKDRGQLAATEQPQRFVLIQGEVTALSSQTLPAQLTVKVTQSSPRLIDTGTSVTVTVDAKSKFIRNLFGASSLAEISVGDKVQIFGQLNADGSVGATSVKNESVVAATRSGTIRSIDTQAKTFVLADSDPNGLTVKVMSDTSITGKDGSRLAFADLAIGLKVRVTGVLNAGAKTMTAQKIAAELVKPTPLPMSLHGTLTALSSTTVPATLTLKVESVEPPMTDSNLRSLTTPNDIVTVKVDANTKLRAETGEAISLSSLTVGDKLGVQANVNANGSLTATIVQDHSVSLTKETGTISSLNTEARTFVITNGDNRTTVAVNAQTAISVDGITGKTWADLKAGDSATVSGFINTRTDTLTAQRIEVTSAPVKEIHKGTISSIDTAKSTFVVSTTEAMVTVSANASTTISVDGVTGKTFTDLQAGATAEVTGVMNSQTKVLSATNIAVTSVPTPLPFSFSGRLLSLSTTTLPALLTLRVESIEPPILLPNALRSWSVPNDLVTVKVDSDTVLQSNDGQTLTLSALRFNDQLAVQGSLDSGGQVIAKLIKNLSLNLKW